MIVVFILLIIAGVILFFVPMDARAKQIIFGIIALFALLWVLWFFGLLGDYGPRRY